MNYVVFCTSLWECFVFHSKQNCSVGCCPPSVFELWTQPICQETSWGMCVDFLVLFVLKNILPKSLVFCTRHWFLKLFFFFFAKTQTWSTGHTEVCDFTELWPTFWFIVVIPFGFIWDLLCAKRTCTMYIFLFIYSDALQSLIISRLFIS